VVAIDEIQVVKAALLAWSMHENGFVEIANFQGTEI